MMRYDNGPVRNKGKRRPVHPTLVSALPPGFFRCGDDLMPRYEPVNPPPNRRTRQSRLLLWHPAPNVLSKPVGAERLTPPLLIKPERTFQKLPCASLGMK
jgi:hypothetical protein